MHGFLQRQLLAALFTALIALNLTFARAAPPQAPPEATQELQAAQLLEATLRTRGPSPDEQKKMDAVYADLAAKYPKNVSVKNAYAAFLLHCGEHDRAKTVWSEAERLSPENSVTQHGLGTVALATGDVRSAASYMAKACSGQPKNALYHFELANVLFLFRRDLVDAADTSVEAVINRSLKHYAEACRLAPGNVDFARGYAETFYGLPKPDWPAAISAWQHLLEISPQKDFALANLATVYLKLGSKDEARACAERIQSPEFAARKTRLLERIEKE